MSKEENQSCCDSRASGYSQDTPAHTASWSPLQPSNNRLTVWPPAMQRKTPRTAAVHSSVTPHTGAQQYCSLAWRQPNICLFLPAHTPSWMVDFCTHSFFFMFFIVTFMVQAKGEGLIQGLGQMGHVTMAIIEWQTHTSSLVWRVAGKYF